MGETHVDCIDADDAPLRYSFTIVVLSLLEFLDKITELWMRDELIPPDTQTLRLRLLRADKRGEPIFWDLLFQKDCFACSKSMSFLRIVPIRGIFRNDEQDGSMKDHIVEHCWHALRYAVDSGCLTKPLRRLDSRALAHQGFTTFHEISEWLNEVERMVRISVLI